MHKSGLRVGNKVYQKDHDLLMPKWFLPKHHREFASFMSFARAYNRVQTAAKTFAKATKTDDETSKVRWLRSFISRTMDKIDDAGTYAKLKTSLATLRGAVDFQSAIPNAKTCLTLLVGENPDVE